MKIKGPGRITPSRVERTKGKSSADKAAFEKALGPDEAEASSAMSGTAQLTSINSLLSLQELPTATDGKSKGVQRAEGLIEHLEAIQHGLLMGHISIGRLSKIINALAAEREKKLDPQLVQIINDIELRAKVELAKLEYLK